MACFDFGAFSLLIERDIHVELALQLFALFFLFKKKKRQETKCGYLTWV
jgi:hypothetical protein